MFPHNSSAQYPPINWHLMLSNLTRAAPRSSTNNGSGMASGQPLVFPPVYSGVLAIEAIDLEMLLRTASANGYNGYFAGMFPYNWKNPNEGAFAKLRRDKLALEEQVRALSLENRELKKEMENQKIAHREKMAEKNLTIQIMEEQLVEQALEIDKLKIQLEYNDQSTSASNDSTTDDSSDVTNAATSNESSFASSGAMNDETSNVSSGSA